MAIAPQKGWITLITPYTIFNRSQMSLCPNLNHRITRQPTTASMHRGTCSPTRPAREHHRLSSVWGTSCRTPFLCSANIGAQRDPNNLGGITLMETRLRSLRSHQGKSRKDFQISNSHLGKWFVGRCKNRNEISATWKNGRHTKLPRWMRCQ